MGVDNRTLHNHVLSNTRTRRPPLFPSCNVQNVVVPSTPDQARALYERGASRFASLYHFPPTQLTRTDEPGDRFELLAEP